ncbi:flagellar hook-associated protein FlgL [Halothermothrix orenii]|uniref:Flagellar hook-associated protein 3 n=1 Tax=Halothermothrix orenii (strain H 168 / OCM 544 / DSM 9562) TaxID=373903 RepID=B8CYU3_HALOH|nr:flagellar hook-associated protein FlgL [Halothermothrix orenii]ACL70462.1 flagellar hook-associated protein 3 [Halothermothrix orenii H 168]
MRITNNIMVTNLKNYLQRGMKALDKYNKKLATGKEFTLPEEDPIATQRSMILHSALKANKQYQRNVDHAQDWLLNTESALHDVNDVLQRAYQLAEHGANDTVSDEEREAIAQEIEELNQHLVQLANTKVAGKYIFSGSATDTKAYVANYNSGTDTYTFTHYQGDNVSLTAEISPGVPVDYNISGEDVFGPNGELFNILENLRQNLKNDNRDAIETRIGELEAEMDNIMKHFSIIGAKTNRLDLSKNRLSSEELNLNQLISRNEDADMAETIMNLKMQENVFRATLASGARIIQPSLVDFIR